MIKRNLWNKLFQRNTKAEEIELHISGATVQHRNPFENLVVPRNESEFSDKFIDRWIAPFCMTNLANCDSASINLFAKAAKEIDIGIVKDLLSEFDWRPRIVGAYFAAINKYSQLENLIGTHLLKSEVCYAGEGYCLALATFGTATSQTFLKSYLDYYLEQKDLWFDQAIAYAALNYLDPVSAVGFSGKWESFTTGKPSYNLLKSNQRLVESLRIIDSIRVAGNLR